jgi:hypothetical protein
MIIFQHFNDTFADIAKLVVPYNKIYCDKFSYTYKDYYGSFDDYYKSKTNGCHKEYWTKLIILENLLNTSDDEWILMLDGDILIDHHNDIGIISKIMPQTKHLAVCRATNNIDEFWNINIGSLLVRNSKPSKIVIKSLLIIGEDTDFNRYEQPALQHILEQEALIQNVIEVFPPSTFNGIDGPFIFHPCGKGFTTTEPDKQNAISNKILALQQKLSGNL